MPVASPPVLSGFILVGRTGHLRIPIEAESVHLRYGSRVHLARSPVPLLELALARLRAEQAIYTVNSFQFTRSARLILAYPTNGRQDLPPAFPS
jgi:hypothetical protein